MSLWTHILERGGLHIVAASFVTLALYFLARWLRRKYPEWFELGAIVVGVAMGASIHEVYDTYLGQPIVKAFTDILSWAIGAAATAYAIKRIKQLA